jgi:ADP-heptose:LPS heptosyltransferase
VRSLPVSVRERIVDGGRGLTFLVIRLGAFGDILRTLPAVRLLRSGLPAARIHWICDERWAAFLGDHRDIDGVVALPRARLCGLARSWTGWPLLPREVARLGRSLRELAPEIALDFHGNLRSGIVGLLSGARVRLGYGSHQQKEGNRFFTTHRVDSGPRRTGRIERNLQLIRALGLPDGPLPDGGLPRSAQAERDAREMVARGAASGVPYAVLSAGASRRQSYKKPPPALLAAAARELAHRGVTPLVAYGPGEEVDAAQVVEASGGTARLLPPTDLRVLSALLGGARLFCGGDSGPLHLACALGCPVVGIYGPTDPEVNAPWGAPHRAVAPPGRHYTGIQRIDRRAGSFEGITGEAVREAVAEVLARHAVPGPAR